MPPNSAAELHFSNEPYNHKLIIWRSLIISFAAEQIIFFLYPKYSVISIKIMLAKFLIFIIILYSKTDQQYEVGKEWEYHQSEDTNVSQQTMEEKEKVLGDKKKAD